MVARKVADGCSAQRVKGVWILQVEPWLVRVFDQRTVAYQQPQGSADDPVQDIGELACVKARETITQIDDRDGGTRPTTQSPYRYRHYQAQVQGGAPHLGEHNSEVLTEWLGWDDQTISGYVGVLVS